MVELGEDLLDRAEAAYRAAVANPAEAASIAEAVVVEARLGRHIEPLVVGLRAQAWSARALLEGVRARTLLNEAARLAGERDLDARLREILFVRAVVHQELGQTRLAQRDLARARSLSGDQAAPELDLQSAVLHQNAGRLAEAATIYRTLLHDKRCPVDIRAKVFNNLALIEAQFGRFAVSMALLEQARELALDVGPALTAYFAQGEAWVMAHAGRLPESLRLFDDAERLYREAAMPLGELHAEYADAMLELRLLPEARSAADRALREFTMTGVPLMQAEALLRVARVALLAGDATDAEEAAALAAASFRRQQRPGWAARAVIVGVESRTQRGIVALEDLVRVRRAAVALERSALTADAVEGHLTAGRTAVMLDRQTWAIASFDRAHALARRSTILNRLKGRVAAAAAAAIRSDRQCVLRHCRAGLADLDRHRRALGSTELRVLASAHGVDLGRIALRTLIRSSSHVDVFNWMERNRAAALMSVQRTHVEGFVEEFEQLRSMNSEIQATGGGSPALVARHSALEQRLRRLTWERSATTETAFPAATVAELRELLGSRVLVEYGLLDGNVFAAVVSNKRVSVSQIGSLEVIRDELAKLSFLLRGLSRRAPSKAAPMLPMSWARIHRLRELLIAPLLLPSDQELVIVPVDVLQTVPWSAMHDAPLSMSPSASFWASARRQLRSDAGTALLVAGPELPAAEGEIRRLSALYADCVMLCPPDSTVSRVAAALKNAGTAHFACHGVIRSDNPMFSGLMLSDGFLTVQELELRNLAPYRVVLAACEATADVSYPGGEMLGFVSALIARGTVGVLGSINLVPDEATALFMLTLHEHLLREPTSAVALNAA